MAVNQNDRECGSHTVIDLFAVCGGLSLGLYQAGWKGLFAIENTKLKGHQAYKYAYEGLSGAFENDMELRGVII